MYLKVGLHQIQEVFLQIRVEQLQDRLIRVQQEVILSQDRVVILLAVILDHILLQVHQLIVHLAHLVHPILEVRLLDRLHEEHQEGNN